MTGNATGGVLLLVEDDDAIGRLVKQYLEQQDGWRVVWLRSGEEAIAELRRHPIRLVVLDIGLPGIDGFEVCRRIRAGSKVPIVMLTARDEEPDRVAGLELGADDYVAKPFSPRELAARIKAILRRVEQRSDDRVLSSREIVLRRDSREVSVAGEPVELTSKEFDLLACFLEHPGIVLSRERLLDLVWGMTYPGGTRTVDVHVAQLRRKLHAPDGIRTVRGAGYKLVAADGAAGRADEPALAAVPGDRRDRPPLRRADDRRRARADAARGREGDPAGSRPPGRPDRRQPADGAVAAHAPSRPRPVLRAAERDLPRRLRAVCRTGRGGGWRRVRRRRAR